MELNVRQFDLAGLTTMQFIVHKINNHEKIY